MGYRSFRIFCVIRIALLAATIFLLIYLVRETSLFATSLIVGAAIIVQVVSLIHYVEKTNRDLSRFLASIRYSDFSQTFSSRQGGSSFQELNAAFADVISEFQRARSEKEAQYRYLQTLVQHIGLGILSFDQSGKVDLINNAAKRLLQVNHLSNIKSLEPFSPRLVKALLSSGPGEKILVKIDGGDETLTLAVYPTQFRLPDRLITIVSMQDIESELAEQEMAAWQKLIRVLTHEIMNSVTPIASLASTVNDLVSEKEKPKESGTLQMNPETRQDIREAAATIRNRSQGLLHFVDAYRNLTRIPKPDFQIFPAAELLERVVQLMKSQIEQEGIQLKVEVEPKSLELTADPELIEQVVINLMLNAMEALRGAPDPGIELVSRLDERGRVLITVADNGPGIRDEVKEKIFTPFFTTKEEGSGIGLSLCRQIMRLHKGTVSFKSVPDECTVFTLRF
ncbi:MAG: GHKL domain-containing protein [candidate division Zixibacteria bacterium]|nr:GHKL domain-containing protein [candidate division Zixibacteria bacterium]